MQGHPKGTISNRWYVDSGCSRHKTSNMALLQDVKPFKGGYVAFAGKKGGSITCQGMVLNGCVSFDNVNYYEQLKHNMLSVSQMCDKEYSVMFDKIECMIIKPGFKVPENWILMRAPRTNDTYQIDTSVAKTTSSVATCLLTKATEIDSILWHRKLGHISYQKMKHLVLNGLVTGVPKLRFAIADDFMPCKKGKQQRKSHKPKLQSSIDTPLELLHMDLFGPISIRSVKGTKDETTDILQYLILSLESLCKLKVRRIRSDNGTEFKNILMELFCLKKGIHHEFSAPYTSQQNGVAERKNRTLIETARTMLSDAKLPVTFWVEAVNTACHVLNRVLVVKRHNKTCYELIINRPPNLDYLVPFGSPCSLLLQYKDRKSKFHAKAVEDIFLGYVANSPCKRVYNIGTRIVEEWFEVDCRKHSIPSEPTGPTWGFDYDALFKSFNLPDLSTDDATNVYDLFNGGDDSNFSTRATVPIVTPDSNATSASRTHDSEDVEVVHVDRDDALANPNTHVGNEAPADPINIESSSYGTQDIGELSTNLDTNLQEPHVPETRVHKNHPIENIIGDPHVGVQTRHRTIAENSSLYAEILDTGIMETCLHAAFVSQLEPNNVKEALADNCWIEAMQEELSQFQKLSVWDLVDLPRGVQPVGTRWVFKFKTDDRHVVVKNKARLESIRLFLAYASYVGFKVYQLDVKSAFYMEKFMKRSMSLNLPALKIRIISIKCISSTKHFMVFIKHLGNVYVDGIIFGSTNEEMCREFEQVTKSKFEMINIGELSFFLGLQVSQREDVIYLHQTKYVQDILSKYKMNDSSTYGTPIPFNHGLHPDKDGKDVDYKLYHGMIGSLMYLTTSRPDIMFSCKKQTTVSVSTCEAEYIAAASGCSQILWIQQQLRDYDLNFTGTPLFIDNNATMSITNNPVKHSKTKHIEIHHHFIRDCAEKHLIELVKVHMDDNFADLFTKAFDRTRFEHLVNMIGMFNPE
ncbi:hypothetical protein L1987_38463 [Smallanthus sonchifolius]|uniref:Uncharacterized protein n=1 Tax=Smallanthus sonchifolius TaxID=185202 RepID=A0ACB9HIQ0_9ASTR|nr:hypothetical protein L1987_38463 [Smallanthus sonchifolius]